MPRFKIFLKKFVVVLFAFAIIMIATKLIIYDSTEINSSYDSCGISHNLSEPCNFNADFQTWIKWRQSLLFNSLKSSFPIHVSLCF